MFSPTFKLISSRASGSRFSLRENALQNYAIWNSVEFMPEILLDDQKIVFRV
jgi:hypothetical protein